MSHKKHHSHGPSKAQQLAAVTAEYDELVEIAEAQGPSQAAPSLLTKVEAEVLRLNTDGTPLKGW